MHLSQEFSERWNNVYKRTGVQFPFGDLAYASALNHWERVGRPQDASFSYTPNQIEDPYLLEFSQELANRFGVTIMTIEEGMERAKYMRVKTVHDWGLN